MRIWPGAPSLVYGDARIEAGPYDGLIILITGKYGRQPWAKAARAQRKIHRCVLCGKETTTEDHLYRPLANSLNRMHRACESCVENEIT